MNKLRVDDQDVLRCPKCGADHLHHEAITICGRNEDAEMVLRTVVEGGVSRTDLCGNASSRNPSGRRDGLFIRFRCEICGGDDMELTIAQHKGQTIVEWR